MKYIVSIPITGAIHIEVEARDADHAEEVAWAAYDHDGPDAGEIYWEAVDCVTRGNVTYAFLNEIEVNEVKE